MEIKKSNLYFLGILLIVIVAGFFFLRVSSINGNVVSENGQVLNGEVQQVVIGEKNLNYYPNEIRVKAGQPVSISLDSSVKGCLRSFGIRDLGVSKYAKTPSETIDFTPTKKGKFTFACSMGMGYGTIIIE